jgi:hypothetical protein
MCCKGRKECAARKIWQPLVNVVSSSLRHDHENIAFHNILCEDLNKRKVAQLELFIYPTNVVELWSILALFRI